jgi:predicted nucleic acid-binding protein
MARRIVLLDTSYVLALENGKDPHHERAKSIDRQLMQGGALSLLHWGILLEVGDGYARVDRRAKGMQLLERFEAEDRYLVYPIADPLLQQALTLYRSRPDKDWSLTDCLSFVLMTLEGVTEALTADVHFRQAGFIALLLETS